VDVREESWTTAKDGSVGGAGTFEEKLAGAVVQDRAKQSDPVPAPAPVLEAAPRPRPQSWAEQLKPEPAAPELALAITREPSDSRASAGRVACFSVAVNKICTIEWLRNGELLGSTGDSARISRVGLQYILEIHNVQASDQATYHPRATTRSEEPYGSSYI
jgi:hypothetical protein